MLNINNTDRLLEISGADVAKCMKCGRCTASCPSGDSMDIRPHQFVSHAANGQIEALMAADALFNCLSCFACIQRCPRDVKPAALIEAARLMLIRKQGEEYLSPDDVPDLIDDETPQQLLVSAFRKYRK